MAQFSLTDSLRRAIYGQAYWIAINEDKKIVGITGIYADKEDSTTIWLGWHGVHPSYRKHGIGSMLLKHTISEAKRRGFAMLKLYSSSDPNERGAHQLYRKFGFEQTGNDIKADKLYFEKKLKKEDSMSALEIKIDWEGPFKISEIEKFNRAGTSPNWDGVDYGLYQIYGRHILNEKNTLLYIGITTKRPFSERFKEHKIWLLKDQDEEDVAIYLGRVFDPNRHSEKDKWKSWEMDIELAEKILIYKYSPNYNSKELTREPDLSPYESVRLIHTGNANRLKSIDQTPSDFHEW